MDLRPAGLSNLWQILIKATPLLFLLGVEDVVYWARELGGAKTNIYAYPQSRLEGVVFRRPADLLSGPDLGQPARV